MRRLLLLVLVLAGWATTPALAQAPCPPTMENQPDRVLCTCLAGAVAGNAPVWGSDVYTEDSAICRAARHARAIPEGGGRVLVLRVPGQQAYRGSVTNGVASADYGPWDRAFTVAAAPAPDKTEPGEPVCPANAEGQSAPLTCRCPAEAVAEARTVWGTGVFTVDSAVCRAARHAGVVGAEGGLVNLVPAPGLPTYLGSTANGVTSQPFGAWSASFTFRQ